MAEFKEIRRQTGIQKKHSTDLTEVRRRQRLPGTNLLQI